ncbi:hypothetical protein CDL60_24700 [Roseateles noduli]|nr:hypothetical protein CDL60_24700 [Roseateles noduli]
MKPIQRVLLIAFVGASTLVVALIAWRSINRHPVTLLEATGPLEESPADRSISIHRSGDDLRIVVRDEFYSGDAMEAPYLTVESGGYAVLHLDVDRRFSLVSSKREFPRLIVVRMPAALLKDQQVLQVRNHDTGEQMDQALSTSAVSTKPDTR